jgi:hypothetical protein
MSPDPPPASAVLTPEQCIKLLTAIDPERLSLSVRLHNVDHSPTTEEAELVKQIPDVKIFTELISFVHSPAFVKRFCRPSEFTLDRSLKDGLKTPTLSKEEEFAPATEDEIAKRREAFLKQINRRCSLKQCKRCRRWRQPVDIHADTGCCLREASLEADYRSENPFPDVFGSHSQLVRSGEHWEMCCADKHLLKLEDDNYIEKARCPVCKGKPDPNRIRHGKVTIPHPPLFPEWKSADTIDYERITGYVCGNCGVEIHRLDVPEPYRLSY